MECVLLQHRAGDARLQRLNARRSVRGYDRGRGEHPGEQGLPGSGGHLGGAIVALRHASRERLRGRWHERRLRCSGGDHSDRRVPQLRDHAALARVARHAPRALALHRRGNVLKVRRAELGEIRGAPIARARAGRLTAHRLPLGSSPMWSIGALRGDHRCRAPRRRGLRSRRMPTNAARLSSRPQRGTAWLKNSVAGSLRRRAMHRQVTGEPRKTRENRLKQLRLQAREGLLHRLLRRSGGGRGGALVQCLRADAS
mmetsp:Transcript_131552/g.380549  ORF Transcript_131552/g.380549 Transcript_131552/m.380549 type:complete len:256 (-) Transcript_131552:278-1045(-)